VKFTLKILFTTLLLVALLLFAWLMLPKLLELIARNQLEQAGYPGSIVEITRLSTDSAEIGRVLLSDQEVTIDIRNLEASFSLQQVFSGNFDSLQARQIKVTLKSDQSAGFLLPQPVILASLVSRAWYELVPAEEISVDKLDVVDTAGGKILAAALTIRKKHGTLFAEAKIEDIDGTTQHLGVNVSPSTGVGIQLISLDEKVTNPISLVMLQNQSNSGLEGRLTADLSSLPVNFKKLTGLSGRLEAKIGYEEDRDDNSIHFNLEASATDMEFAGITVEKANVSSNGQVVQGEGATRLSFEKDSVLKFESMTYDDIKVLSGSMIFPSVIEISGGHVTVSDPGDMFFLNKVKMGNTSVEELKVAGLHFNALIQEGVLVECGLETTMRLNAMWIDETRINASPLGVIADCAQDSHHSWSVNVKTGSLDVEGSEIRVPLGACGLDIESVLPGGDSINGKLQCAGTGLTGNMHANFSYMTGQQKGKVSYSLPSISPGRDTPLISSLVKDWTEPFDINSGTIAASGHYQWQSEQEGKDSEYLDVNLTIKNVGGFYDDMLFSGVNYAGTIELLPAIKSSGFSVVTVQEADIGVPVTDISAKIRLSKSGLGELPAVGLNAVGMKVLGGEIRGNDITIDLNSPDNEFVLVVDGLDMEKLVELQNVEGLSASGRLDGYIPVYIEKDGVVVRDGKIVNQPPGGFIRYKPPGGSAEMEKSALGSEMVFRIIEDLRYHSISADVDYQANGDLDLSLAIQGNSPKYDSERPVHFNLNLQQNLIKLLQGLRYAEGLSNEIDRNVQQNFRK
jgi:hypothetical protein